jgi:hypothetical protein
MENSTQENEISLDIVSTEAISAMTRAEIDIQISTAKRFPRVLSKVKQDMLSFATLDQETAQSCFYTLKRKDKSGQIKLIQGPSVRLAEIAASCFGNIRSGARVVSNDGKKVVAQGVCHDLEKNVFFSMENTRRITTKDGRTFSEDMQIVTANAASAIALRNAITKTIPRALILPVFEAAKKVAIGDIKSLSVTRSKVFERLQAMGATEEQILNVVDARKVDDVDLTKLEYLIGLGTALRDGEISIEEAFPVTQPTPTLESKTTESKADPATPEPAKPEQKTEAKPEPDWKATLIQLLSDSKITGEQFLDYLKSKSAVRRNATPADFWNHLKQSQCKAYCEKIQEISSVIFTKPISEAKALTLKDLLERDGIDPKQFTAYAVEMGLTDGVQPIADESEKSLIANWDRVKGQVQLFGK